MSTVYIAGPTPGTPFIDGIYTRTATRLELAGHQVINPANVYRLWADYGSQTQRRQSIGLMALNADAVCTLHGADPRIIKAANTLDIPVRTLAQLTPRSPQK